MRPPTIAVFAAKCQVLRFLLRSRVDIHVCKSCPRLGQCQNDLIFERILSRMMNWAEFEEMEYSEEACAACCVTIGMEVPLMRATGTPSRASSNCGAGGLFAASRCASVHWPLHSVLHAAASPESSHGGVWRPETQWKHVPPHIFSFL